MQPSIKPTPVRPLTMICCLNLNVWAISWILYKVYLFYKIIKMVVNIFVLVCNIIICANIYRENTSMIVRLTSCLQFSFVPLILTKYDSISVFIFSLCLSMFYCFDIYYYYYIICLWNWYHKWGNFIIICDGLKIAYTFLLRTAWLYCTSGVYLKCFLV